MCTLHLIFYGYQIEEGKIGAICSMYGNTKNMHFDRKTW
jgi:hypothetical protein